MNNSAVPKTLLLVFSFLAWDFSKNINFDIQMFIEQLEYSWGTAEKFL